eukprot:3972-Eustigmatos_ZCMA.PRE.1
MLHQPRGHERHRYTGFDTHRRPVEVIACGGPECGTYVYLDIRIVGATCAAHRGVTRGLRARHPVIGG